MKKIKMIKKNQAITHAPPSAESRTQTLEYLLAPLLQSKGLAKEYQPGKEVLKWQLSPQFPNIEK